MTETLPQAYDRCSCGRLMSIVLSIDIGSPDGVTVFWCAGCGEVNVHYHAERREEDERYKPRAELIGRK